MFKTNNKTEIAQTDLEQKEILIKPSDQLSIIMGTNNGLILLESTTGLEEPTKVQNQRGAEMTYLVENDSTAKIPTIGRIKLGGLTIRAAEELLEEKFSINYQKPFVKLKITNRKVTLFYEQGTIGRVIPLPEERMTLIDAIAVAGGLSQNSKSYKIKIMRGDQNNPKIINYNIRTISDLKRTNLLLEANDVIYVDARPRYLNKFIVSLQPYLILASTTVLVYSVFNQWNSR